MRKLGYSDQKEFYIGWFDADDVPRGIITGPFESTYQAEQAIEALESLHPSRRLIIVGGNLQTVPYF